MGSAAEWRAEERLGELEDRTRLISGKVVREVLFDKVTGI